ncbi:uncharacterized protein LOC114349613 [Ostrinia furnacalis]|uniref:uncharacterized protein LOC114349613 n=1 Tax=Ostrinia furnacalis TaxID=93504 RepID=UPI0010406873|nr:uncharacterized protein LOC114349613 [Ostrinia furnacalis]
MSRLVWLVLVLQAACAQEYAREGFIDRLSSGMKFATDLLGTESVAQKVAEFVVKAFQITNKPSPYKRPPPDTLEESSEESFASEKRPNYNVEEAANPMSPLKYLVRLFGLQPGQISAVAVNALVFVAQMISTFLAGNRRPNRPYRSDDPIEWVLNKRSSRLQELISRAKNESLFNDIEGIIEEQGSNEETSCIRLLVCKVTPFVHKMQEAVFGKEGRDVKPGKLRGAATMYRHLPSTDEIKERSDICERKHRDCDLNQ